MFCSFQSTSKMSHLLRISRRSLNRFGGRTGNGAGGGGFSFGTNDLGSDHLTSHHKQSFIPGSKNKSFQEKLQNARSSETLFMQKEQAIKGTQHDRIAAQKDMQGKWGAYYRRQARTDPNFFINQTPIRPFGAFEQHERDLVGREYVAKGKKILVMAKNQHTRETVEEAEREGASYIALGLCHLTKHDMQMEMRGMQILPRKKLDLIKSYLKIANERVNL